VTATTATIPGLIDRRTARRRGRVDQELLVDNFAGAGGASLGIEAALGRCVDVAINHDATALWIHEINHPETDHLVTDVWDVDPVAACAGRPVGLAWFSPDCTHFSLARGGKPRKKSIRSLAWVVTKWAKAVRPRLIILENVREFLTWGPLGRDSKPIAARTGETFRRWKGQLERLGYTVEHRLLTAADYGTPTIRKRLFVVARCDGRPIRWPERTHAPRAKAAALGLKPWRSAAECIDWSLPCPSIFERKRPLAEATLRRIAAGLKRFVIDAAEPYIVRCAHGEASASGPRWGSGERGLGEPLPTVTASKDFALVTPYVTAYHGLGGGDARGCRADEPLLTQDTQNRFALVAAFLAKHYGGVVGTPAAAPLGTVTAIDHHSLVAAHLQQFHGQSVGSEGDAPLPAMLERTHEALCTAHLTKLYGTCADGADARSPMPTITGGGNHVAEVRAFLVKYFGTGGAKSVRDPADTITGRDRFGLVQVAGVDYQIIDIGLRMLTPKELLRAQFGRFADEYVLVGTKSRQVAAIGNSVCPEVAEALVRANY
jgi:DNA (cytosine-5)-methyltransferase 1